LAQAALVSDKLRVSWIAGFPLRMALGSYDDKTFKDLPAPATAAAKAGPSTGLIMMLWGVFIMNRAFHPLLIDLSKDEEGKIPYQKISPVIVKSFLCVLVCNFLMLFDKDGPMAGIKKCWGGKALKEFSGLGVIYSVSDYLEMLSMAALDGAAYQVLLQSKLIVTAAMNRWLKGPSASQTNSQWATLVTVTVSMSLFMIIQSGEGSESASKSVGALLLGTFLTILKVVVSCYTGSKADMTLKKYESLPLPAQLSQLMSTWGVCCFILCAIAEPSKVLSMTNFFGGWNWATWMVTISFMIKTSISQSLLKLLDALMKNIGEAVAVLVIYACMVIMPMFDTKFETNTFMAMMTVVMAVLTYIVLKQDLANAKKAK